jgi:hypothetical protein
MGPSLSRRAALLGSTATLIAVWGHYVPALGQNILIGEKGLADFARDDGFDLQVRKGEQGTIIRVTGDTVIVDSKRLASLVAPPSLAKTKIQSLTFDARLLILRGPLSIEGGLLQLLGETIRFEKRAQVALLPGTADEIRRLAIVADKFEFVGSARRPIDLQLAVSSKVEASIAARSVTGVTAGRVWSRFVDSLDATAPPPSISILVGAPAEEQVVKALESQMEWPLFFAAKVRKHFNRNPFDTATCAAIDALAGQYKPFLERWRDPGPYAIIASVSAAIRNKTDVTGRSAAFTPKQDLNSQRSDITKAASEDRFDALATLIAATAKGDDAAAVDLQRVRSEIAVLGQQQSRLEHTVDQSNQGLQVLVQRNASTDQLIRNRSDYLKLMQDRDYQRMKDAQAVKQWTAITASVVLIAATAGGASPAVAAGAAAGVAVTGEAIYSHNIGNPMSLADALTAGTKTYAAAHEFVEAWDKLKADKERASKVFDGQVVLDGPEPAAGEVDKRKPLTKVEASKRVATGLADAVKKARGINGDGITAPTQLSLTERENEDEDMKSLLAQRAADTYQSQLLAAQIAFAVEELESLQNRRLELQALDIALREAKPQNDQQNARWNANAQILWGMNVARISAMVENYKKSLYFETGRAPDGVASVLDYPNELEAQVAAGILDPLGGFGDADLEVLVEKRLRVEKTKFLASVNALLDAVDVTYTAYLNSRTEADVNRKSVKFATNSPNPVIRAFLETLNGQIRQQIVAGTPVQMMLPAYIPYVLPSSLNPVPERLIRATVVDVEYNVPNARIGPNALEFNIIHPGYGEMKHGGQTSIADLRTSPTDWKYFTVPAEQITRDWLTRNPTVVQISKDKSNRFYTYYPARAPYFLVVNVRSRSWKSLPEIRSIEFGLEVMQ